MSAETEQALPTEVGLPQALALAMNLHRAGYIEDAEILYGRILDIDPQQPDALTFLGVVRMHKGRIDEAIAMIEKAIAVDPGDAGRRNNLGNVFLAAERVDDAVAAYEKSLALDPNQADALNNLGIIYRAQKRFEDSARAFERAIEIDSKHVEAWSNYGNLHASLGRVGDAIHCYSKALTLRPHDPDARRFKALAHASLGEFDAAGKIYREWLDEEPDHPGVRHLLAACTGENVPERAGDKYIVQTFDSFSKRFDAQLAALDYRAPQLIAEALGRVASEPAKRLEILDVGCGTGLCGPLVAPFAKRLAGVDLSPGMLGKARLRGVYDELIEAELTRFLGSRCEEFDVIVSADTLIYLGPLETAFTGAARALRAGGVFLFSLEAAEDTAAPTGHRLNYHGRFSHTRGYVQRTLRAAGFEDIDVASAVLRRERGEPVAGLVATARKPARPAPC